jgi:hypothetical protein
LEHIDPVQQARESIRSMTRDPVAKLLLRNSQLTQPQLETLLAYSLSGEEDGRKGRRRFYRPSSRNISRGSFNRTLIQAQNNVIRSIYTVLLLGYAGLFDSPSLQPFMELSDTIQSYVEENRQTSTENIAGLQQLEVRLSEAVASLARRQSFKDTL